METALGALVFVLILAVLVVLVLRMRSTKRVSVSEDVLVGGRAEAMDPLLVAALSSVQGAQYVGLAPGRHALELKRIPVWVVVPVFLLFPVGLVFLFVRESVRLDVALFEDPQGTTVRLSGRTESATLERVRAGLAGLSSEHTARL